MAIAGYEYRQNGGIPVDVGLVTSYLVTGLSPYTDYDFELRSYDGDGVRSAWTSPPITVKTFRELPAGVFNVDFDPNTLSLANNDPVSTITDSIGSVAATGAGGTRPLFKTAVIGTYPVLEFDGTDDYLDAGDNFDLLNRSTTVFVLAKKTSSDFAMFSKCDGATVGGYAGIGIAGSSYGGCFYNSGAGGQNAGNLTATDSTFALYEFRFNRSLGYVEAWKNGLFIDRSSGATFTPDESTSRNTALTYLIGKFSAGLPTPFGGQIARLIQAFHNGPLGHESITRTYEYMTAQYGSAIFNPDIIITCEGDSLTEGYPVYGTDSYPHQLAVLLNANSFRVDTPTISRTYVTTPDVTKTRLVRNVGEDGKKFSDFTADAADQVDQEFNPDKRNILVIYGGINDFTDTAATIEGYIQTYCEDRKTANPGLEICVCTLAAAGAGRNTKINAINTWLRANYSGFADYLADLNGPLNDYTDTTYYNVDELHLTAAGYGVIAGIVKTAIGL